MPSKNTVTRRQFLSTAAAASTISILPRSVLGGTGFVAPSDKINMALVGSGTMGLNLLMGSWLPNENLQVTAVVDPNKNSTNYRDWSRNGMIYRIRGFLDEPEWGNPEDGIPGGRDVGKFVTETYYAKNRKTSAFNGCTTYADYRELLAKEEDLDGLLIMTPEHLHGTVALAAMRAGKHAVMHKTMGNVFSEARMVGRTAAKSNVVTHFLPYANDTQIYQIGDWIRAGAIGQVREIHNWSLRPMWPQGMVDWLEEQPVPKDFDWDLWLGPVPHKPYNLDYTHALFRGWYDFGSGCLGDMGQYSLGRVYRMLGGMPAPVVVEGFPSTDARVVDDVSGPIMSKIAFPKSGTIRMKFPAHGDNGPIDIYWYDGGNKPPTPDELYPAGEELGREGMLFVGTEGKILGGFLGDNPRIIPDARMKEYESSFTTDVSNLAAPDDEWVNAVKEGRKGAGGFETFQGLAEATCIANLALMKGRRLVWDSEKGEIVNAADLNKDLNREYREGWEL
jgi:predicted dehydrogenase